MRVRHTLTHMAATKYRKCIAQSTWMACYPIYVGGGPSTRDRVSVCVFDKFHLTFNFKSKVSRDILKNGKWYVN